MVFMMHSWHLNYPSDALKCHGVTALCTPCALCIAVHQELRDSGFEANSTTYNALISAYGKLGQLERVLEVYKDMVWRGLERRCGLGSWVLLVSPLPAPSPCQQQQQCRQQ
jgi:pentatricopeptide repeat protein